MIFIGSQNIAPSFLPSLQGVQCPHTSEMVWKAIHGGGLTVVFQIVDDENSDFSLKGVGRVLVSGIAKGLECFKRSVDSLGTMASSPFAICVGLRCRIDS